MAVTFNIDVNKLTALMDEADGSVDGKISKKVWNNFNSTFETKKIKNYKEVEEANDIIAKYFDKITKSNDPRSLAAAQVIYAELMQKTFDLNATNKIEKITELLKKINKNLKN